MARASQRLVIDRGPDAIAEAASEVAAALGWEVDVLSSNELILYEDATRLHCHCSPLRAELQLKSQEFGRTDVLVSGKVAGWGPVAAGHVRKQTDLLTRKLGLKILER